MQSDANQGVTDELRRWLRWLAGPQTGPEVPSSLQVDDVLAAAEQHGVHRLLYSARFRFADAAKIGRAFQADVHRAAATETFVYREVNHVLEALRVNGVAPLVLKGTALAYTVYEHPWQRPREDVDLFVRESDVPRVRVALEECGYVMAPHVAEPLVTRQFQMRRFDGAGLMHQIDVHWRILNARLVENTLTYADVVSRAVPLPSIGPAARGLDAADALVLACLHRVVHHANADRLIWLFDVHLLAAALTPRQWSHVVDVATRAGTRRIVADTLQRAASCCGTPMPEVIAALCHADGPEPSAVYLGGRLSLLQQEWLNLRKVGGWRTRMATVVQHVIPSAEYMRAKYGEMSAWRLPWFYARRVVSGAPRWLRR
jgi:hypothetical protein